MMRLLSRYNLHSWVTIVLIFLLCACQEKKEEYYPNGSIKYQYEVREGLKHGIFTAYYESGEVKAIRKYSNDIIVGDLIGFYKNGDTSQIHHYYKGVLVDTSRFFETTNTLQEIQVYDSTGILIDYVKYNHGIKDRSGRSKSILFLTKNEKINKANDSLINIRLGNRDYDQISYHLGYYKDSTFQITDNLPKSNPYTAYVDIKDSVPGEYTITGIAMEQDSGVYIDFTPFSRDITIE
ncbi:toxin-antitoxin system YwqK family antitoxin [Roseivirga sp. BDSF3-8]|uniref:toxin-antitoxin system YwqK family antitoxin n=1 Tax=Roseivirga sp. BDSF3-8 TaxID=3241598 RepID=UPI0035322D30